MKRLLIIVTVLMLDVLCVSAQSAKSDSLCAHGIELYNVERYKRIQKVASIIRKRSPLLNKVPSLYDKAPVPLTMLTIYNIYFNVGSPFELEQFSESVFVLEQFSKLVDSHFRFIINNKFTNLTEDERYLLWEKYKVWFLIFPHLYSFKYPTENLMNLSYNSALLS